MEHRTGNRKQTNLILQGGILAVALLLCAILRLLCQMFLTNLWGDHGNGIYGAAYGVYFFAWLITSYAVPSVIVFLLKFRLRQKQYKNAGRIIQAAFLYTTLAGAGLGVSLFFGSNQLAGGLLQEPLAGLTMKVLAAALLLTAWNGVLRGFFLSNKAAFPVALSLLFEQLVLFGVGFLLAGKLQGYGAKIGALLLNEDFALSFAASGFAGGILAGAFASLLFLLLLYLVSHSYFKRKRGKDGGRRQESALQAGGIFITCLSPFVLFGVFTRGQLFLEQICFRQFIGSGLEQKFVSEQWGVFFGKYKLLAALPVILSLCMTMMLREHVRGLYKKEDYQRLRDMVLTMFKAVMLLVIPLSVMLGMLSEPLLEAMYHGQDNETAAMLLLCGFLTPVFMSVSYFMAEILLGMEKKALLLLCSGISFGVCGASLYIMLAVLHLDIFGVLYADILFAFCLCLTTVFAVQKNCRFRYGLLRSMVPSVIAAAVMGIVQYLSGKGLSGLLPPIVLCIVLFLFGGIFYLGLLLLLHGVTARELKLVPGGSLILKAARALRLPV